MNEQTKIQKEIVDKLRIKMKFRREELNAAKKQLKSGVGGGGGGSAQIVSDSAIIN